MSKAHDQSTATAEGAVLRHAFLYALLLWGLAFAYTFTRYTIFGPVPADQAFLYLGNKSLSLAGVALFTLSFAVARQGRPLLAGQLGAIGSGVAFVHVAASLSLLAAGTFSKLHLSEGRLTISAQLMLLAGALAVGTLSWEHTRASKVSAHQIYRAILAMIVAHVTALGLSGWLQPAIWHGGLPPISLVSALIGLLGLAMGFGLKSQEETR